MDFLAQLRFGAGRRLPMYLQTEAAECGLASLGMVASFHGHRIDLAGLRHARLEVASIDDLAVHGDVIAEGEFWHHDREVHVVGPVEDAGAVRKREIVGGAVGPGADERGGEADADGPRRKRGVGDVDQLEAAVAQTASDLPHRDGRSAPIGLGVRGRAGIGVRIGG